MEELKWISEIKDIAFSLALLYVIWFFGKAFLEKYPVWKAEDQKAKDARAEIYRKSMEGLALQVGDVVKTSQESTRVLQESLSKAAEKQQARHGEVMSRLGGIFYQENIEAMNKKV